MKERLFSTLWFGMSALAISLFLQFIPSLVSPVFYWPNLRLGFFEILLIVDSAVVGCWLGPRIMRLKPKTNSFVEIMCLAFDALGYGLLGGFINLMIAYLVLFVTATGPLSSEFWQALVMFFIMGGWGIIFLWTLFAWLFWLVNFLLDESKQLPL